MGSYPVIEGHLAQCNMSYLCGKKMFQDSSVDYFTGPDLQHLCYIKFQNTVQSNSRRGMRVLLENKLRFTE